MVVLNARCRSAPTRFASLLVNCRASRLHAIRDAGWPAQANMFKGYVIEVDDQAVGIAARDDGGYRFMPPNTRSTRSTTSLFSSARQAAAAARVLSAATPLRLAGRSRQRATVFA
jgi:hypothetical protein